MRLKYYILIIAILGIVVASVYGVALLIKKNAENRLIAETQIKYKQLIDEPKAKYCEIDEDCDIAWPPTECCPCPRAFNKEYAEEINKLPLLCIPPEVVCKECLYDQVCPERECIKCVNNACKIFFPQQGATIPDKKSWVSKWGVYAPGDKDSCEALGGKWEIPFPDWPDKVCNLPNPDGGKECNSSSDCQGLCIAELYELSKDEDDKFMAGETVFKKGKCRKWTIIIGCYAVIERGIIKSIICAD